MVEECDCGEGYHIDQTKNLCIKDPIVSEPGYIADCQKYEYKLNGSSEYEL